MFVDTEHPRKANGPSARPSLPKMITPNDAVHVSFALKATHSRLSDMCKRLLSAPAWRTNVIHTNILLIRLELMISLLGHSPSNHRLFFETVQQDARFIECLIRPGVCKWHPHLKYHLACYKAYLEVLHSSLST